VNPGAAVARACRFAVWAALAAGAIGCDDCGPPSDVHRPDPTTAPAATTGATTAIVTGHCVVRGTVSFKGVPPAPEEVAGAKCHSGAAATSAAPVVVSTNGGLKDVMVYVKDAPQSAPATTAAAAVLDQVNCQYVPHLVGVRTGQVLRVTSSDATLHNVHALCVDNPQVNFGMTGAGQSRDLTFPAPERFAVKCDVHPWMRAHVYVFDHPFFAATRADGRFEITGLPPGDYTLVFSHPFLGDRERKFVARDSEPADADAVFEKGK
jgi:plastocyanin